jgi:hypothetical protein
MKVRMLDDVVWRELADEVVLLNLTSGLYFGLEGTGGKIWRALADKGTTEAAIDVIAAEYDASREKIEADVTRLVDELRAKGLIGIESE